MPGQPPRVFFNDFAASSLNIKVQYWFKGQDWWAFQAHAERFNLHLLRAFNEAGIEFAFPTQTLFLADDPARDLSVRVHRNGNGHGHEPENEEQLATDEHG
jgi:MscS family membrane protein